MPHITSGDGATKAAGSCLALHMLVTGSAATMRQDVRQEAERSAALRAVPPGDAQPSWRRPGATSMRDKRAATRRVEGAAGQSRVAPFPVPDVRVETRQFGAEAATTLFRASANYEAEAEIIWGPGARRHRRTLPRRPDSAAIWWSTRRGGRSFNDRPSLRGSGSPRGGLARTVPADRVGSRLPYGKIDLDHCGTGSLVAIAFSAQLDSMGEPRWTTSSGQAT